MNQTMKQYDTLFNRYWDEAEYYARLYGINWKKDSDGAWDAFRHAYATTEGVADNDEIADRIHDALKKGDLITDPFEDARYYYKGADAFAVPVRLRSQ
jgi:hypothetical protein